MTKGIGPIPDYMVEQSVWLHRFLEYIGKYKEKNVLHSAQMSNKPLWKRVSDKSIKNRMGKKIFGEDKERRENLISNRSALYKCIEDD